MGDRRSPLASSRSSGEISLQVPRWGFWKGLLTGAAIEVPMIAGTVWLLARFGFGNPGVGLMHIVRLTAAFAGIAAVFTAGGIGRLSAYASATGGRKHAVYVAARAHAAASAGLVLIAAIPHGQLPGHSAAWLAFPAAGLATGAITGALIGLVCGGAAPVELADVWSLARRPGEALRSWLDPRDLVRLGAAVRHRTSHLFEGIFDPAPPPPPAPPPAPASHPPDDPEPAAATPALRPPGNSE